MATDLTGMKFGKLKVVKFLHKSKDYRDVYECLCDCTRTVKLVGKNLTSGNSSQCRYCKYYEMRSEKGQAGFNRCWLNYVHNAKQRNLSFELDKEQFRELTKQNCHYCGVEPRTKCLPYSKTAYKEADSFKHSVYTHNGIDRVDTKKGYSLENCITCCEMCNKAKMDNSLEDFLTWVKRISDFQFGEKK